MGKKKGAAEQKSKRKEERAFDFSKCGTRQIALQISYVGWDYKGFAAQDDTEETIEGHLFAALKKTCLIQGRESSRYSRCARTDKGVSALGQVVSLRVRSKLEAGLGVFPKSHGADDSADTPMEGGEAGKVDHGDEPQQDAGKQFWLDRPAGPPHAGLSTQDAEEELPYLQMLNAVLPPPIRAIAWCPVEPNFNARFACTRRSYRYFFTKGDLDIARMKEACALLIGQHDFRNFCKIDKSKGPNQSYCRHIIDFQVEPVVAGEGQGRYAPWSFNIVATAFLWHQVRAMAAVLFAIGRCEQPPSFVSFMLDIARCPVKPAYNIASEEPLLLCDCIFPGDLINWQPPLATHARNDAVVSAMCSSLVCRAALVEAMSVSLASRSVRTGPSSENGKRQQARGAADDAATGAAAEACHSSGGGGGAARSVDMVAFASVPRAEVLGLVPNTGRSLLAPPPGCKFESASVDDAGPDKSVGSKRKLDT